MLVLFSSFFFFLILAHQLFLISLQVTRLGKLFFFSWRSSLVEQASLLFLQSKVSGNWKKQEKRNLLNLGGLPILVADINVYLDGFETARFLSIFDDSTICFLRFYQHNHIISVSFGFANITKKKKNQAERAVSNRNNPTIHLLVDSFYTI